MLAALSAELESAFVLAGAAEALRATIGAPRSPALVAELDEQLSAALAALGPRAEIALAKGRRLDLDEAVEFALERCVHAPGPAAG